MESVSVAREQANFLAGVNQSLTSMLRPNDMHALSAGLHCGNLKWNYWISRWGCANREIFHALLLSDITPELLDQEASAPPHKRVLIKALFD